MRPLNAIILVIIKYYHIMINLLTQYCRGVELSRKSEKSTGHLNILVGNFFHTGSVAPSPTTGEILGPLQLLVAYRVHENIPSPLIL